MSKYELTDEVDFKSIDMNDFFLEVGTLVEKAKQLAPEYAAVIDFNGTNSGYNNTNSGRSSRDCCAFTGPDEEVEIDRYGVVVRETSNSSCNCHPEYHTFRLQIPSEVLIKYVRGEDWKTDVMKETELRKERERIEAEQLTERNRRSAEQRTKKEELATLERLQAKYGK